MKEQTQTLTRKEKATFLLPDAKSMSEAVINQAMEFCASKMHLDGYESVLEYLKKQDEKACMYCRYSIAQQVGDALGALDRNVNAVYVLDFDATPDDLVFNRESAAALLHLIVRVGRKTTALISLVDALDKALIEHYARLFGLEKLEHLLDVQVVDETDVEKRLGYGAMISSIHQQPIRVWER